MDYQIDLDPTHCVIRLTVTTETLTLKLAEDFCQSLSLVVYRGGPYTSIIDLSRVTSFTLPADAVRDFALRTPTVPRRTCVAVARERLVFGLVRMFQLIRDFAGQQSKLPLTHQIA